MLTFREYKTADWIKIKDAVEPFMLCESTEEFNRIARRGIAVTAVEDDEIMACGGVAYMNENEGLAWVKVSKKCLKHPYRWARTIRETFRLMTKAIGSMTVTTYILKEFCKGEKLARFIGMEKTDDTCEFKNKTYNKYMVVA